MSCLLFIGIPPLVNGLEALKKFFGNLTFFFLTLKICFTDGDWEEDCDPGNGHSHRDPALQAQDIFIRKLGGRLYSVHCPKDFPIFPDIIRNVEGKNEILRGIFRVVSGCLLHFVLYPENLDYFLGSVSNFKSLSI